MNLAKLTRNHEFRENIMFKISIPTEYYFGSGALDRIADMSLPGKKALICTTRGKSVRRYGYLSRLERALQQKNVAYVLFDELEPNPTKDSIMSASLRARQHGCDFIIGFGGGSAMDASKAIAFMAVNSGDLWDYCTRGTGKGKVPEKEALPIVCISTTAGTGSELDAGAVITNTQTGEKSGVGIPRLFPTISIVDPDLTLTVPPQQTAFQGLDTFYHVAEGYISKASNLMSEMFALTAVERTAKYLPVCVQDGNNLEARTQMSFANSLGGLVMACGRLTSQHPLEHVLSAHYPDLPHGAGLLLLAPSYFATLIRKGAVPEKFVTLAQTMGMKDASKPEDFLEAHRNLLIACGVSEIKMSDYGIRFEELKGFASEAVKAMGFPFKSDPVFLSENDFVQIYESAWR